MPAGLVTIRSEYGPEETMNRLEAELVTKGMRVFARVDHAAGADTAGLPLQPTELLIFGNARGGTPLMQAVRSIGVDLPIRVLVWQDATRDTWLTYNDPRWLARRHGLGRQAAAAVTAMTSMLQILLAVAAGSPDVTASSHANRQSDGQS
jgi:uncharacterized protein (DUF302 family)